MATGTVLRSYVKDFSILKSSKQKLNSVRYVSNFRQGKFLNKNFTCKSHLIKKREKVKFYICGLNGKNCIYQLHL